MKLIDTTTTAVEKLRDRAKELKRSSGLAHKQCLELAANAAGYESWHHVRWCREQERHYTTVETSESNQAAERTRFLCEAQQYMDYLESKAVGATIERFPTKGDTFHSVEVDGNYFYGAVGIDGPAIVRKSKRVRGFETGWVQLGVAGIYFTSEDFRHPTPTQPKSWCVCKYSESEPRVLLADLTPAARFAVAHEFGIPVHFPYGEPLELPPQGFLHAASEWFYFYLSPAFRGLCELAKLHPRKAHEWGGNSYLGRWGDMAHAGKYVWDDVIAK